jgi:hypothetical protein
MSRVMISCYDGNMNSYTVGISVRMINKVYPCENEGSMVERECSRGARLISRGKVY